MIYDGLLASARCRLSVCLIEKRHHLGAGWADRCWVWLAKRWRNWAFSK